MPRTPSSRSLALALLSILVVAAAFWVFGSRGRSTHIPPPAQVASGTIAHKPATPAPRATIEPVAATVSVQALSPGDEEEVQAPTSRPYASMSYRHAKAAEIMRREDAAHALLGDEIATRGPPGIAPGIQGGPEVGIDTRANDRNPTLCPGCGNLPLIQTEGAVAVLGSNIVASWNEGETNCGTNTRQNYGWSTDGGLTFTDAGGTYPLPTSLFGDAIVKVNQKTGRFYLAGIGNGTATTRGIGLIRGSFGPGGFTTDIRALIPPNAPIQLHDKPWMSVDSLTGNVYVSWTYFSPVNSVMFQALNADLAPIGPVHTISEPAPPGCGGQWSQIAVGANGEVWVSWLEYRCESDFVGQIKMRRSDDHGLTFGPTVVAVAYGINSFHGPMGFLRAFGATPHAMAVDRSNGPHRGRLYLSYDACVNYRDDNIPITTATFESEPNNSAATANPMNLVPGGRLRGVKSGAESDWFALDLQAGETFFMETIYAPDFSLDSTRAGLQARVWCPSGGGGLTQVVRAPATSNGVLFSALHSQIYYLELNGTATDTATYVFTTAKIPVTPSDVALDYRDQLVSWSDDGVSWSTVRLTDSAPGVQGQYPTVGVDGKGRVHAFWMEFGDDPVCGLASSQLMRSSGDGGVTWGPSRRITGAASTWLGPYCNQLNGNTMGDYQSINTDGDIVVAAFNDTRHGDPDIFVSVSNHALSPLCAPLATAVAAVDTLVDFSITNAGNYARTLEWRVEDTRGWIASVSPAASGSQTLPIGAPLQLHAMVHAVSCNGDSSILRWITSDPFIPGDEDTCFTVIRCRDIATPVLASLVSAQASLERVTLLWSVGDPSWAPAGVWRRTRDSEWTLLGQGSPAGAEVRFEDRTIAPGTRYAYRLELRHGAEVDYTGDAWVEVPVAARFEIAGIAPNPLSRELEVAFSLPSRGDARLELFDVAGRSVMAREVGDLGPGAHRIRLDTGRDLPAGIYTVRLVQGAQQASVRASIVR
ncbi:MAG TPA: hypothetical protein VJY35_10510 [Candidatus Eisenbacteria bacterium]|nr:hypothetical protein [Candidatus Eisenbacteria bacterium]